jgi:hypothetical protein
MTTVYLSHCQTAPVSAYGLNGVPSSYAARLPSELRRPESVAVALPTNAYHHDNTSVGAGYSNNNNNNHCMPPHGTPIMRLI